MPGAADAITGRLIEEAGFDAVYATGAGFANASFAWPDLGLVTASEVVAHAGRIVDAVQVPVIVDADTGYGDILQVRRTVKELERSGVAAIQLEDQVLSKRCGHFDGQRVVPEEEMVRKLRVACDTRMDPELVIVARTDARAVEGFDAAVRRACTYADAGADVLFVEALTSVEEIMKLPTLIDRPLLINMVEGGKTPLLTTQDLQELGYKVALFANTALRASMTAIGDAMRTLRVAGTTGAMSETIMTWDERQRLMRLDDYLAFEQTYLDDADPATDSPALPT